MGAFFLFKSTEKFDKASVQKNFSKMGFAKPKKFYLGPLILWLYKKQLIAEDNYTFSSHKNALFAAGTIVYKGKSYTESLASLLADFENDKLDYKKMIGAYCLIFLKKGKVYILTDKANIYHIFTNSANSIICSSFLALLSAQPNKLPLNTMACLEALLIGYVTGPDTIVNGIYLANDFYQKNVKSLDYLFLTYPDNVLSYQNVNEKFDISIEKQLRILKTYYSSVDSLCSHFGADIGISGGYDSRLNLLLSTHLSSKPNAYTYDSPDHIKEKHIAELLIKEVEVPFKRVAITKPELKSEMELTENLNDALFFFDGRTNNNMGTYNDIHTRRLRISILGENGVGLNGLGGELYRNRENLPDRKTSFSEWLKYYVIDPFTVCTLQSSGDLNKFIAHISNKYKKLLKLDHLKYINKQIAREFYRNVWLPYAAGVKNSAENQLAFFLMPFSDYQISLEALKITPHIGIDGKFEAAMISALNQKVAQITSSYGFEFDKEPMSYLFKSYLRSLIPNRYKNLIYHWKIKWALNYSPEYISLYNRHSIIQKSINLLHELALPINLDQLILDRTNRERTIFIGYFLLNFLEKVSIESPKD